MDQKTAIGIVSNKSGTKVIETLNGAEILNVRDVRIEYSTNDLPILIMEIYCDESSFFMKNH